MDACGLTQKIVTNNLPYMTQLFAPQKFYHVRYCIILCGVVNLLTLLLQYFYCSGFL